VIFHLAAVLKAEDPDLFYSVNAGGTAILLDAIRRSGQKPRVVLLSSSAIYGDAGGGPISEETVARPLTGYGHSKLAMEWLAGKLADDYGLSVVFCRPFNLVGPGLPAGLVLSSFADQVVRVERGLDDVVRVGNLDARRDFLDIRDAVRAYRLLAEQGKLGEIYNVCSGKSVSIRECLDILIDLSPAAPRVVRDPGRMQPVDVPVQVGDPGKIHQLTGWAPTIPLEQSLEDLLNDARRRYISSE
jgi:GDP-4-dehydro-6-deoxy-D-mannose reductase